MDQVYLFMGGEWEDIVVFLSEKEAIQQSIKYPNDRVEIFKKSDTSGYIPTYNYYKNGILIKKN